GAAEPSATPRAQSSLHGVSLITQPPSRTATGSTGDLPRSRSTRDANTIRGIEMRSAQDAVRRGRTRVARARAARKIPETLALGRELLVDQLLEALVGLRATQAPAVHEERRSRVDAEGRRLALVGLDGVERLLALQALLELRDVEPAALRDLRRLGGDVVLVDLALLGEETVVHRPELVVALLKTAFRGDGGILGPGVDGGERVILENEANLVAVFLEHLRLDRGVDAAAERTLKVRILDDRHLRVRRTARRLAVELDLVAHLF